MSEAQAQGAITLIAYQIFGRKENREWKLYESGKKCHYNTLYVPTNINRTKPYMEALIHSEINNEVMQENAKVTLIYSSDVFVMNGVGSYVVQSLNIN